MRVCACGCPCVGGCIAMSLSDNNSNKNCRTFSSTFLYFFLYVMHILFNFYELPTKSANYARLRQKMGKGWVRTYLPLLQSAPRNCWNCLPTVKWRWVIMRTVKLRITNPNNVHNEHILSKRLSSACHSTLVLGSCRTRAVLQIAINHVLSSVGIIC